MQVIHLKSFLRGHKDMWEKQGIGKYNKVYS